jgi:hypothetical protein
MLYAGLDLSRKRLDVHVLREDGSSALVTAVAPDADALRTLARRVAAEGEPVRATIESMNGARFVHDSLEFAGWEVLIADAQRVRGLAPLAAKTDKIDARVLAELTRRALVPEIWLPTPEVRAERERARFRLHLVRHRTALKNRVAATLMTFGHPRPMADLFGVAGLCTDKLGNTPWYYYSGYPHPMVSTLNAWMTQPMWYAPFQGSSNDVSWLVYDIDYSHPVAANVYEKASSATPHLVGHPTNQVIKHWVAVRGYASSGAQSNYADSVHGTTFWTWSKNVQAYSTIASGQTGMSYMMDTIPYGYVG